MRKSIYIIVALISALLLSVFTVLPANAFIYPDCHLDAKYELFGPHADQLIFQMYEGLDPMWIALGKGEIDLTDWPLTTTWRNTFSTDPDVKVVTAGGEAGLYTMDFNYNNNSRMGNPPGSPPNRPNPVYDSANGIPPISNNEFFRLGCGNLFSRPIFNAFVGDAGIPMLTVVPVYMGGYVWPGATGYVYSRVLAEAQFALGKIKQDKTTSPWTRFWDRDDDNVVDAGEKAACVLKQTWRMDQYRKKAGEMLNLELRAMNFTFDEALTGERTGGANYQQVMLDKNYHITTLGWINMGPDPDFLYDLHNFAGYWDDPESSAPNSAGLNDPVLNDESAKVKFAVNAAEAKDHAWLFQERFEAICAQIPLFCNQAFKASSKYYTGGTDGTIQSPDDLENIYRRVGGVPSGARREWLDICNKMGQGSNNFFTLLNMYPNCTIYGTGNMTIRYGWKEQAYPAHINPFYSEWYWDGIVLDEIYDTLGYRDPYDLSTWKGYLIKAWSTGTWLDPASGLTKSKCTITLRPDVKFQDGTPMTVADVVFSLVEAGPLAIAKGFQPPWWWPTGELVKSMSIIDAYTVEILYDVQSFLAESWTLGGFYIIPKHIWLPIIESGNPSQFAPDPNIIGSGPYRYYSFSPTHSLVMVANKPGSRITTDRPGSSAITSPGCFVYCPVDVNVAGPDYNAKIFLPHDIPSVDASFTVKIENRWMNQCSGGELIVDKFVFLNDVLLPGFPKTDIVLRTLSDGTIEPDTEVIPLTLTKCKHELKAAVHITGPAMLDALHPNPWIGQWINATLTFWVTAIEDVGGALFAPQLPVPDCIVDISDIYAAALAYGSYPGHPRWNSICDLAPTPHDYYVDISDIYTIALAFGQPKP